MSDDPNLVLKVDPATGARFWINPRTNARWWASEPPPGNRSNISQASATPRHIANPNVNPSAYQRPALSTSPGQNPNYPLGPGQRQPNYASAPPLPSGFVSGVDGLNINPPRNQQHGAINPTNPDPQTGSSTHRGLHPQRAHRTLQGNPRDRPGTIDPLDPEYKVREKPAKFFKEGKVFLTLHSEAAGSHLDSSNLSEITKCIHGENVYSEISRFVIIRASKGSCGALRILTYGRRGCGKNGVHKSDHARIYTTPTPPDLLNAETNLKRGEAPVQTTAFRVEPSRPTDFLDPRSRINLGKIYTIEHNVKVRSLGYVVELEGLKQLHHLIWHRGSMPSIRMPYLPAQTGYGAPSLPGGPPNGATPLTLAQRQANQLWQRGFQQPGPSGTSQQRDEEQNEEQDEEQDGEDNGDDDGDSEGGSDEASDSDSNNDR